MTTTNVLHLGISYPDFKNLDVIDPNKFDTNNSDIQNKVNEVIDALNGLSANGAIQTVNVGDAQIITTKLADQSVATAKIVDGNVTTIKIADGNITTVKIADGAVTSVKVADGSITLSKMAPGVLASSNVLETRKGTAQAALDDLNTRLTQAMQTSSVSEVSDARASAPLGKTYTVLKDRLDDTDTRIGYRGLSFGSDLTALLPFENTVQTTRGLQGTFTRASNSNDPYTLALVPMNQPRFVKGKYGNGIFIEEGTTNLVTNPDFETVTTTAQTFYDALNNYTGSVVPAPWTLQSGVFNFYNTDRTNLVQNSSFETVTTTAQVFADALTSYTGTTVPAPWALQVGSFTFGASGATSGANGSIMVAGNTQWKPILGSDGATKLALTSQATFTTPSSIGSAQPFMGAYLWIDATNYYEAQTGSDGTNKLFIFKCSNGVRTILASVAYTELASTTYTISLSLDNTGLLTAHLQTGGADVTGSPLTYTDASPLAGGFQIGVGGDTGVIISNAKVTAPFANGWTIGGDARVAWALSQTSIAGKYSVSAVGLHSVTGWAVSGEYAVSASTAYTLSNYMNTSNVGTSGVYANINWYDANGVSISGSSMNVVVGTTSAQHYNGTFTSPSNTTKAQVGLNILDSGTVTFDDIQLETGTIATQYIRNDSTSGSATSPKGATSNANGALITAGNAQWKPVLGSDGTTKLAITEQATFTAPSSIPSGSTNGVLRFHEDGQNLYQAYISDTTFYLVKEVAGTANTLASIAQTISASTTYCVTLSLDNTGLLTAKLYQGADTTGTLLQTLTATDTSLSGGFLMGVGGDTGVIITNAKVTAPFANSWTIGGDTRVAWALSQSAISGKYSVNAVGVAGVNGFVTQSPTVSASTTYTISGYMTLNNVGVNGADFEIDFNPSGYITTGAKVGTSTSQRYSATGASPSGTTLATIYLITRDSGTVTFDNIQLEQKPYATSFTIGTRNAETLTLPASVLNASAGTISLWANDDTMFNGNRFLLDTANTSSRFLLHAPTNGQPYEVYFNDTSYSYQTLATSGRHLFTVTWNGTAISLYLDGAKKQTYTLASPVSFSGLTTLYIGCGLDGTAQWNNWIDDLAIWNRALTDSEVFTLFNSGQGITDAIASTATRVFNVTVSASASTGTISFKDYGLVFTSTPTVFLNPSWGAGYTTNVTKTGFTWNTSVAGTGTIQILALGV